MAEEKPFQLDKKELLQDVPLMAKPIAGALVDWANKADFNHDGKADLAQLAPYIIKAMPFVAALAPLIDWDRLIENLLSKYVKDEQQARRIAERLVDLAEQAATR